MHYVRVGDSSGLLNVSVEVGENKLGHSRSFSDGLSG